MLDSIATKIFADGADLDQILHLATDERIQGFTTNPTLMWKAGLTDYSEFAKSLLERITDKPISFEVVADDEEDDRPTSARDLDLGRQCLRQGSRHDVDGPVVGAARARAVGGRGQGQRDRR